MMETFYQSVRSSSTSEGVAALFVPKSQGDKVSYDEFNGASFSRTGRVLLLNKIGVLIVYMIIIGIVNRLLV